MDLNTKTNEELLALYRESGDLDIKQELTLRYLYIVKAIAVQMRDVYVGFTQIDDIINEGVIVLMKALDKYDFSKNAKFETYVSWRIRGMIIDIARKQDWVPRNIRKNCKDIREKTMEIYTRTGALPAPEEVAVTLGMDQKQYNEAVEKMGLFSVLSLDMVLEESQEKQRVSGIQSTDVENQPEEQYLENELKETLKEGIRSLKEKEQMVLSLYYSDELTMKEIASVLEISEPRVSQIHASAIHKLEQYLRKQMA